MIALTNYLIRMVMFVLVVLAFTSQLLAQDEPDIPTTFDPNELISQFETPMPEDKVNENCTVPVSSLGGQGHQVSGVEHDLTVQTPFHWSSPNLTNPLSTFGPDPVVILVVDSFNRMNGRLYELSSAFTVQDEDHLADLTTDEEDSITGSRTSIAEITHGALVMNHINVLLDNLGFDVVNAEPDYVLWHDGLSTVAVMAVDGVSYGKLDDEQGLSTTQHTMDAIEAALGFVRDGGIGERVDDETIIPVPFQRAVINMSFAVLPCAVVHGLYQSEDPTITTFEDFYIAFGLNHINFISSITDPADPLNIFFSSELPEIAAGMGIDTFVPVASSGNSALPFPFSPALNPIVLSASAWPIFSNASQFKNYANAGEFTENGGWFVLENPENIHSGTGGVDVYYLGTSFAAPALSTRIALRLTHGSDTCMIGSPIPPIAYAGEHEDNLISTAAVGGPIQDFINPGMWWKLDFDIAHTWIC